MKKDVIISHSRFKTEEIGFKFAENINQGTVIALRGDLGAGKTCFTSGFARGMGYLGDVNSPTFAIVNEYKGGRLDIYHYDMYRISGWEDLYSTGFFDAISTDAVVLIEWSENIEAALPDDTVNITIETLSLNDRRITVEYFD